MARWLILITAIAAVPATARAQPISDAPTCADCQISVSEIAILGDVRGPGELSTVIRVKRVGDYYWVFSQGMMPSVFDRRGDFVQVVGRRGEGPGEFRSPTYAWSLPGDSVLVRDGPFLHVLGPNRNHARSLRSPLLGIRAALPLGWPDELVVNASDPTPDRFGYPIHVLDFKPEGPSVVLSTGASDEVLTPSSAYTILPRRMAASRDGGYWTVSEDRLDVTKWSASHHAEGGMSLRPAWFRTVSDLMPGGPTVPPSPRVIGIVEDARALLWLYVLIPSPSYQEAWRRASDLRRDEGLVEIPLDLIDFHLLYHTRVLVIDPAERRLLASRVLEERVLSVTEENELAMPQFTPEGFPLVRVVRPEIHGLPPDFRR